MNCAFETNESDCKAIVLKTCSFGYGRCCFFKTPDELAESVAKTNKRLRTLSTEEQNYIAEKYHSGKKPWRKK